MSSVAIDVSTTLTTVNCGQCGGVYAINERYRKQCQEQGKSWTCPYCRIGWGYQEGQNAKLQKQLEQERKRRQWAESDRDRIERSRRAQVGVTTRLKNRIGAGVCPCCKRTFNQLARHMENQHPGYGQPDENAATMGR